jgi:alkylated DNA repair dioxygenase AlkB
MGASIFLAYASSGPKGPSGLAYSPNVVSPEEEEKLMKWLSGQPWETAVVGNASGTDSTDRKVIHYGRKYNYVSKTLEDAPAIPKILADLASKLEISTDQIIVNRYEPGQGIAEHIDSPVLFGETITGLSLGSATQMDFRKGTESFSLRLEPRSLLVITGEARYKWSHSIPRRLFDYVNDLKVDRSLRMSITFRKIAKKLL